MKECNPCPLCGSRVHIGYACGDYFVSGGEDDCPVCGIEYSEMHASEKGMEEAWEKRVQTVKRIMGDRR